LYVQLGLQAGEPEGKAPLGLAGKLVGQANDLVGSLATGFMIGVALWVAQFGVFAGAGTLTGYVIVGLGLLLPWMSWPQLVVFGVGLLIGLPAWLGSHDYPRKQQAVERHSLVMTFR
jgi:hypothetical protein